jgi:hypothetical protein
MLAIICGDKSWVEVIDALDLQLNLSGMLIMIMCPILVISNLSEGG